MAEDWLMKYALATLKCAVPRLRCGNAKSNMRMLTLLPWNRREPLTRSLAHRVFTAAPTGGLLVPPSRALRSTDAEPPVLQGCC